MSPIPTPAYPFATNLQTISTTTLCAILAVSSLTAQVHRGLPPPIERTDLVNWSIQSSAAVRETGDVISLPGYDAQTWYAAHVPTTVLNTQVSGVIFPDPTYDINFQKLPGALYDSGDNFLVDPQPPDNPYLVSWWYRTQAIVRRLPVGNRVWLNFDSINYRANIWLNGKLIADSTQVAGMYRGFEFDVTIPLCPVSTRSPWK